MATAQQAALILVYTTPAELRQIANVLEARWKAVKMGQEVPSYILVWEGQKNIRVDLVIDQGAMPVQSK